MNEREKRQLDADQLANAVVESENAIALVRATGEPKPQQLADHKALVAKYQAARLKAEA